MVPLVPTKLVSVNQSARSVETWTWPFRPGETCSTKFRPLVARGCTVVKASCSMNALLDTKLTLLVVERFAPKSTAYAFTVFVPAASVKVTVQFVQPLVLFAMLQALVFN